MARNLFDDDDWNTLRGIVTDSIDKNLGILESGILARLDKRVTDQGIALESVLAQLGEPSAETIDLRNRVVAAEGLLAQLRRVIGSGNLETELQGQVNIIFGDLGGTLNGVVVPETKKAKKEKSDG